MSAYLLLFLARTIDEQLGTRLQGSHTRNNYHRSKRRKRLNTVKYPKNEWVNVE